MLDGIGGMPWTTSLSFGRTASPEVGSPGGAVAAGVAVGVAGGADGIGAQAARSAAETRAASAIRDMQVSGRVDERAVGSGEGAGLWRSRQRIGPDRDLRCR